MRSKDAHGKSTHHQTLEPDELDLNGIPLIIKKTCLLDM